MSRKQLHICVWISRGSFRMVITKVLLEFKAMRLNDTAKEMRVSREKKRCGY